MPVFFFFEKIKDTGLHEGPNAKVKYNSKIEKSVRYFFRRSSHSLSWACELHKEEFYWSVNEPGRACTQGTSNNDDSIEDENNEDVDWAGIT